MMIDLKSFTSREETYETLEKLSKCELHTIADEIELIDHKSWNKATLVRKIVFFGRVLPMQLELIRNTNVGIYTGVTRQG